MSLVATNADPDDDEPDKTPDEIARLQPNLIDVPAVSFVERLESKGEYTGARLRLQRPEVYQRVIMLLSEGHGAQFIQDETGVSKNTVKAVRTAEGETIDLLKARIAERNFDFADQAGEAASIILSEIMSSKARRSVLTVRDVQSLKVAEGIATQNGQLLTGKPTANISVELFSKPSEDLNAAITAHINGLKSAGTHLVGEKPAQKDGPDAGNATAPAPAAQDTPRPNNGPVIEIEATAAPGWDDKQSPADTEKPPQNQA